MPGISLVESFDSLISSGEFQKKWIKCGESNNKQQDTFLTDERFIHLIVSSAAVQWEWSPLLKIKILSKRSSRIWACALWRENRRRLSTPSLSSCIPFFGYSVNQTIRWQLNTVNTRLLISCKYLISSIKRYDNDISIIIAPSIVMFLLESISSCGIGYISQSRTQVFLCHEISLFTLIFIVDVGYSVG